MIQKFLSYISIHVDLTMNNDNDTFFLRMNKKQKFQI